MIDVLLMAPASRMDNHYRPPMALMYVASYYREQGKSVKIVDFPFTEHIRNSKFWGDRDIMILDRFYRSLVEVEKNKPKEIGISCYSTEFEEVKDMIRSIRKISKARIVVGGVHPTLRPEDFDGIADEVIRGRRDAGYACYDLIDLDHYLTPNPYGIRGVLLSCGYFMSGFACPGQCKFCVANELRPYFKGKAKTSRDLYNEIMAVKNKYGMDAFYILDDVFTLNKTKVKEFCSLIEHSGLVWGCQSRVNTIDEETIKAMAKSGCIQLDIGIERGSDEALKFVKKGITIQQVKDCFKLCHKYRVRTFANFLVNIPGETPQDWYDIDKLIQEIKPTLVSINVYRKYLGCQLDDSEPSAEMWEWKRKAMLRYNWAGGFKWSALRHLKLKHYRVFPMLIKEGWNQLRGQ